MATKDLLITQRQKVRDTFGKSEKDIAADIKIIRDWLQTQPHLPEIPSDNVIEVFLVNNKFSIERTKPKLDMYYTIETLMPEIYKSRHPRLPHMQESDKMVKCCLLPKLTEDLYRVHVIKCMEDPDDFVFNVVASLHLNFFEVRIQEDLNLGDLYIYDYEHLKMGHVMKLSPVNLKKFAIIWEKVFSNRVKGIHLINYPPYVDIVVNIAKTVISPKIMQRLHLHSNIEDLYKYVSKDVLPSDYGGEERSIQELSDLWKIKFEEYSDRFDKLEKMSVNEELRPEPLNNDYTLGFHGNFKKLDVD